MRALLASVLLVMASWCDPASAETVKVGGQTWHYRAQGDRGPPTLFLHPLLLDSRLWTDQLAALCAARRCIAPDLPGHGFSDTLPASTIDLDQFASGVLAFLDAIGAKEPVDVVAFAASGVVAAKAYASEPRRFRSMVLVSAVFIDEASIGLAAMESGRRYRQDNARLVMVEGKDALFRRFNDYILAKDAPLHPRARYKTMLNQTPYETIVAFMESRDVSTSPEILRQLKLPVMIPVGSADPIITEAAAARQLALLPRGRVIKVQGSGRLMPLEAPKSFNEALQTFWTELP